MAEGDAAILVTAVGDKTMYGSIAGELSVENDVSPLKDRLTSLAKTISKIGYVSAVIVALVHLTDAFWIEAGMNPTAALSGSFATYGIPCPNSSRLSLWRYQ